MLLVLGKQATEARQFLLVGNGNRGGGGGGGGGLPGPDSRALLLDLVEDWISFQELVLLLHTSLTLPLLLAAFVTNTPLPFAGAMPKAMFNEAISSSCSLLCFVLPVRVE